ncbi:hypothetical protein DFS30_09965 [Akkermansia muciniphila]|nr:hypothetical protein CXT98_05450 [Akkermansia muciniphila]QAA62792.1 hypothetical protein C1O59_10120 [Akkermansia muciniphila]QAA65026.1 hypothetical protein C1O60_10170 [Akkermansia muciniphila]QAA67291.1 hypothetical protein C1O61_10300 [Akkermansia muciniphila]QAA69545.1 hypothetical protein C1O62_10240 [Akkermansia muciniphila]
MGVSVSPGCPMDSMGLKKKGEILHPRRLFPVSEEAVGWRIFPCQKRPPLLFPEARAPCHVRSPFELTGKSAQVSFNKLASPCR